MRNVFISLALAMLLLSGCGVEVLTSAAIQGEMQGRQAEEMTRQLQRQEEQTAKTIPEADLQKMEEIRQAINEYGMATGYYPNTLDDLVPGYLSTPPRTESGEAFVYNNQNGYLAHPQQQITQDPKTDGMTPKGQRMNGSGVRESMPQQGGSALNRSGGYARENIQSTTDEYSDRQMQQIEELGF